MRRVFVWIAFLTLAGMMNHSIYAQANFFASSIFRNKVSFNPSQVGLANSWRAGMLFKTPIDNSQPGLAKEYLVSVDGPISESAGVGFNLLKQNTGILSQTLFHINYGYGMKIRDKMNLRLGFSGGFKTNRIVTEAFNAGALLGDLSDPALVAFNSAPPSFFSSFGLTFYTEKIELQATIPNLSAKLQSKNVQQLDYVMAQAGFTYKHSMSGNSFMGENGYLKVFGGVNMYKQTGTIIVGALQLSAYDFLTVNAMYNTTNAITAGIGIDIAKNLQIDFNYTIGGLYSRQIYGGSGLSEIHLYYLFNKK